MAHRHNWALRSELYDRIDSIHARSARAATIDLASDLDAIRKIAIANGMTSAVPLVYALEASLAEGLRGPLLSDGLALLRDAIACGRSDASAAKALAAAYAVRMSN